ncbi:PKD domain-containing protein [uncultured Draconibacterium sp.]|uniref:PKD domain-containing protein n=1 Tax=uncultured Draconibacterium sp. TaxID=1573823 RepID=UPI0029C67A16|nr:PKD domain-containing protein [uncultured Draconibacterium sp.]
MIKLKPVFLGVLFLFLGSTGFVLGQTKVPVIENLNQEPVQYCADPVAVAPFISIENIKVDDPNEGMKISISGYRKGEDVLVFDKVLDFKYNWNENSGVLEISGIGTDAEYELAVSKVYYQNVATSRTPGTRSFSINLLDADYLPATQHFYRFVPNESISWSNARSLAASESMKYYGLQGYLATIRSKAEQDFIYIKTEGTGWIGGSDEEEEGTWKWVEGPDKGIVFWKGNESGSPVNAEYSHWGTGEPNNQGGEDYAHILYSAGTRGYWNDLPNGGGGSPGYIPQGFLIEYGGMPGDPEVKLSAVAYVTVEESIPPELDENVVSTLLCGDKRQEFKIAFTNGNPSVNLEALNTTVDIENETSYNPVITVPEYGIYSFLLKTIDDATCEYIDTIEIGIHNQPEAIFNLNENECYGYNLQLSYSGENFEETEFIWYYNDAEFESGIGIDSVTIPLGFEDIDRSVALKVNEQGCIDSSLALEVKVKPNIIVSVDNEEGCSPLITEFSVNTSKPAESYLWNFDDGSTSDDENPNHKFLNPDDVRKTFDISLTVLDINGCENTAVYDTLVKVYPVPTAGFDFSPQEVLITAPKVEFTNTSHAATVYFWDFGDSTYSYETDPVHSYENMGIYNMTLEAGNSFGCADTIVKQIRVVFDKINSPTAFSPNLSNPDDEFRLYAEGVLNDAYNLLIFNRWGELVFESNSQEQGWDGKMRNGNFAPAGVYTWVLEYTDFMGDSHKQKGNITLLF